MNQIGKFRFSAILTCYNAGDRKQNSNLFNFAFSGHLLLSFSLRVEFPYVAPLLQQIYSVRLLHFGALITTF
jgi:hypothetical protein